MSCASFMISDFIGCYVVLICIRSFWVLYLSRAVVTILDLCIWGSKNYNCQDNLLICLRSICSKSVTFGGSGVIKSPKLIDETHTNQRVWVWPQDQEDHTKGATQIAIWASRKMQLVQRRYPPQWWRCWNSSKKWRRSNKKLNRWWWSETQVAKANTPKAGSGWWHQTLSCYIWEDSSAAAVAKGGVGHTAGKTTNRKGHGGVWQRG